MRADGWEPTAIVFDEYDVTAERKVLERELAVWRAYWNEDDDVTQEHALYVPGVIRRFEAILERLDVLDFGEPTSHAHLEVVWYFDEGEGDRHAGEVDVTGRGFAERYVPLTQAELDERNVTLLLWRPRVRDEMTTALMPALGGLKAVVDRLWLPWLPVGVAEPEQLAFGLDIGASR